MTAAVGTGRAAALAVAALAVVVAGAARARRAAALAIVALAVVAAGCKYSGLAPNGAQRCADVGLKRCADGYHCAIDGRCWRDGSDPPPIIDALIDAADEVGAVDDAATDDRAGEAGRETGGSVDARADASDDTANAADASADAADGADATVDAGIDAGPTAGCPATLPNAGGVCSPNNLLCTFGDAPRPECRDKATCTSGAWTIQRSACLGLWTSPCPETPPAPGSFTSCPMAENSKYCRYPGGAGVECRCVGNPDTAGNLICAFPVAPTTPGCPPMLPNAGTSCGATTLSCAYPCFGQLYMSSATAACSGGIWLWTLRSCNAS